MRKKLYGFTAGNLNKFLLVSSAMSKPCESLKIFGILA